MPSFKVTLEISGTAVFKLNAADAAEAEEIAREFFNKGFQTSKKLPESIYEDPEVPDDPDFVVEDDEHGVEIQSAAVSRFVGETERAEAQKKIFEAYKTEDVDKIYVEASARRVGTQHAESLVDGICSCAVCGTLDCEGAADPIFHPEQWI